MDQFIPLFLANALLLGFRHGFDWDHVAAICDIVGTSGGTIVGDDEASKQAGFFKGQKRAIILATIYALGHAFVCLLLGSLALFFHVLVPPWLDKVMEILVGITLIILGSWLIITLRNNSGVPRSAWMSVLQFAHDKWVHFSQRFGFPHKHIRLDRYGPKTCFGIGVIHGIGAETATQILMIAAIGGSTNQSAGASMLLSFVFGLFVANLILSLMAAGGFLVSSHVRKMFAVTAALTGVFSVLVGATFVFGCTANFLPSIK